MMTPRLHLDEFRPVPQLIRRTTSVDRPRYPVIDVHNHAEGPFGGWQPLAADRLVDVMNAAGVRYFVDLDGGWGETIMDRHLAAYKECFPDRFAVFGGVDWGRWQQDGDAFADLAAQRLARQVARGAEGLKIWKPFGLHVRDHHGQLVPVDDVRLDPLWARAGELDIPVLIHVGDPVAFFEPLDATNERYEELITHPDWHFGVPGFPTFSAIAEAFARLVERHAGTRFVGAHVAGYPENLDWVSALLDRCPNLSVDISGRIAELGRQPYRARQFFLDYADRIVFGLDLPADVADYRLHYRFLESADEYFAYSRDEPPPQGRWQIYGLHLPDDVLRRVYHDNAAGLLRLSALPDQSGAFTRESHNE